MGFYSFCFLQHTKAQFFNLPNDYFFARTIEKQLAVKDSAIHSGLQPYVANFSDKYTSKDDKYLVYKYISDDPAIDVIFYKHLISIEPKGEKFKLHVDPILNLEFGKDINDTSGRSLYNNTRGIIGSGSIGDKFYFETIFTENQSVFPDYISKHVKSSTVVPGQGRWKNFKTVGYDYAFSSGFIALQVNKNFNIQLGHGKHKIGHGYRSLVLSDNAFNYPYLRLTQQWFKGRVQYVNIYAAMMNLVRASVRINPFTERLFQKKAGSFQYLSANVSKYINLGLFQGMMWEAGDERNRQHLKWQYFNPLIFSNLIMFGPDGTNNIIAGADLKIKLNNKINVYGQFMYDGSGVSTSNASGYQFGVNIFDVFKIKNLSLQLEQNKVNEGTYLSPDAAKPGQSYFHYNEVLAYTPGWGKEFIIIADYKKNRFFTNVKYNYQSKDSYKYILNYKFGYVINPSYNLNISLGIIHRTENFYNFKTLNNETNYIYIGLKTNIYNLYYDF